MGDDRTKLSIVELLAAEDHYRQDEAVKLFVFLHTEADKATVTAELKRFRSKDHRSLYSVVDLLRTGSRLVGSYGSDQVLADYLDLHPDRDAVDVERELSRYLANSGQQAHFGDSGAAIAIKAKDRLAAISPPITIWRPIEATSVRAKLFWEGVVRESEAYFRRGRRDRPSISLGEQPLSFLTDIHQAADWASRSHLMIRIRTNRYAFAKEFYEGAPDNEVIFPPGLQFEFGNFSHGWYEEMNVIELIPIFDHEHHHIDIADMIEQYGNEDKAVQAYAELHPRESEDEIRDWIRTDEHFASYSVYEHFCQGPRWRDTPYEEDDAIKDYLRWHPEADETALRAELKWSIENDADYRERYSLIELFRIVKNSRATAECYGRLHVLDEAEVLAELEQEMARLGLKSEVVHDRQW